MSTLQAHPFSVYKNREGVPIVLDQHTLILSELDESHLRVLRILNEPRDEETIAGLLSMDTQEATEIVAELKELELVASEPVPQYRRTVDLKPQIRAFRIVLTEHCNLRCVECFVTKNQGSLRTMTAETLDRVIAQIVPYGSLDRVTYHFFGGEPLSRFDLMQRAVTLTENAVSSGRMVRPLYTVTTNHTILTDEILAFFKHNDVKVGVSIDGLEEVNDRLRVYQDGRGSFQRVARNYDRILAEGIDAHVLVTPHPLFLDRLPEIFRAVVRRFPMKTVTINTPLHHETLEWTLPGTAFAEKLFECMRIAHEFGVSVDSAASPPLAALAGGIRREGPCALTADRIMASVSPDGQISFCSQKWSSRLVQQLDSTSHISTPVCRVDECERCEARHICGGPCPALRVITGQQLDDNKCDFMRALLRHVADNLDLFEGGPHALRA